MPAPRRSFVQRFIRWRFLIVVNVIIVALLGLSLGREIVRNQTIQGEIDVLQSEADSLATRNFEISELQTAMQTESFIEREARLKLGMKKPGESVIVITESDIGEQEQQGDPSDPLGLIIGNGEEIEQLANTTKWWYYFFNKSAYNAILEYES